MQIKKRAVKFSHKHVQRRTGTSFTVPRPFGTAQDRPSHIRCSKQQHSNTVVSVVVCPVWSSNSHDPVVCGASSHLRLLLPLLSDKPTRTARCRVAWRPATALFFCDGDAAAAAVANLSSSSFLLRFARLFLLLLLLLFTLPLPCLFLLPQLALSLLLPFLPLFIGFPLWFGSLRIRHLLEC